MLCEGQPLLPAGQSDLPRKFTVSTYCPRCNDIYFPKSSRHANIDGAYFGTTFPHLFLMTFPACVPPPPSSVFVPRIFGFRIRREAIPEEEEVAAAAGGGAAAGAAATTTATSAGAAAVPAAGASSSMVTVSYGSGPAVRSVGPSGNAPSATVVLRAHAAGPPGSGGRGKDVATVLPRDVMASARRSGQDDFFDEDELDMPVPAAPAASSATAGGSALIADQSGGGGGEGLSQHDETEVVERATGGRGSQQGVAAAGGDLPGHAHRRPSSVEPHAVGDGSGPGAVQGGKGEEDDEEEDDGSDDDEEEEGGETTPVVGGGGGGAGDDGGEGGGALAGKATASLLRQQDGAYRAAAGAAGVGVRNGGGRS